MIYIIAPHSLKVNITSHNRILSFYNCFKKRGWDVKVIFPSSAFNMHWFTDTVKEFPPSTEDFVTIQTDLNLIQKFAFRPGLYQNYRLLWYISYFIHYIIYFKDLYYSNKGLSRYFAETELSDKDILVVSGPPFSFFEESGKIAAKSGSALILDYRDPWNYSYVPVYRKLFWGKLIRLIERGVENKLLNKADSVNCVHEKIKASFPKRFHSKINIIQNGSNAAYINPDLIQERPTTFKIVYLGTIHDEQLKDERFFFTVRKLIEGNMIDPAQFQLAFIGADRNKVLLKVLKKYNLLEYAVITKRLGIAETMDASYDAAAFLHLKYSGRSEVYPSKHTDYLALQKTILLPASDRGVLAESIVMNDAGAVCDDQEGFYKVLNKLWEKFTAGESMKIERTGKFLYSISRESEAERFATIIHQVELRKKTAIVPLFEPKREKLRKILRMG